MFEKIKEAKRILKSEDSAALPSPQPSDVPQLPWTFEPAPIPGAINNHQIRAADGTFVGSVYRLATAKLICELVNRGR